jgi:hypothetical protein
MTLYAGADPGREGGIVVIDQDARLVASLVTDGLEPAQIIAWLRKVNLDVRLCALELVAARPREAPSKALELGRSAGIFEGLLLSALWPVIIVKPTVWQASCRIVKPPQFASIAVPVGASEAERKEVARRETNAKAAYRRELKRAIKEQAMRRWPDLPITTQATWALADAAFMADHARRVHLGQEVPKEVRVRAASAEAV